nr:MAG TPA: hypothetical protein [Bacteriophage sp.]
MYKTLASTLCYLFILNLQLYKSLIELTLVGSI